MSTPPDPADDSPFNASEFDDNPFTASEFRERVADPSKRSKPGPIAVFFSVVLGLVVAVVVFAATFFFTCLGVSSIKGLDNEFGFALICGIAGITAIATFAFTFRGIQKIVRALK